jgi:hypothetical protein
MTFFYVPSLQGVGRREVYKYSMNFFQRRKILKKVNYLDMTPVRTMNFDLKDDGRIDILLPRFENRLLKDALRNSSKGEFIHIHLDEIGSAIWILIDGHKKVNEISDHLNELMPEKLQPAGETVDRVTQFLSRLYQERYISFREIIDERG